MSSAKSSTQGTGEKKMKYVIVTGGVLSGIGKGITASSIGVLMKAAGLRVTAVKIDPYLNVDAGTMSPYEHGETYVLDDGGETDLDLGNYERFMDFRLHRDNNITTGKVYQEVISKERRGDYLGKTVQVVPHITTCIQDWLHKVAHVSVDGLPGAPDVCIVELGGTVGDIESAPFVEALRQFQMRHGYEHIAFVHVSLVPIISGEPKTKPTQHTVRDLRSAGLTPDILACRSTQPLTHAIRQKLAMFTQVDVESVISVYDVSNLYRVPLVLQTQGVADILINRLNLPVRTTISDTPVLSSWQRIADTEDKIHAEPKEDAIQLAFVGKYTGLQDAYHSVLKAIDHAAMSIERRIEVIWIESSHLEEAEPKGDTPTSRSRSNSIKTTASEVQTQYDVAWTALRNADCVLVPGGFGDRGINGKINAIQYARTQKVPFLGICLGMQLGVIEYAQNVLGWADATSAEFDPSSQNPVVVFMPEIAKDQMGGNMRLGSRRTLLKNDKCLASKVYGGTMSVEERHRHRYEVNPEVAPTLEKAGLLFTGQDETGIRMEIIEIEDHPFYFGCQYHPEFKSRPGKPSPPFLALAVAGQEFQAKKNKA